jgi:hypothetical protein
MSAVNQPAGTYYLRIATSSGFSSSALYSFRVSFDAWNPNINTCTPMPANGDNCAADQTGGKINIYWQGAPGATQVKATLSNMSAVGGCPAGTSGTRTNTNTAPTSPTGSWSIGNINRGYYSLNLEIWGPNNQYFKRANMPIKMDCNFAANGAQGELEPTSPVVTSTVESGAPAAPVVMPTEVPLPTEVPEGPKPTPQP